MSNTRVTIALLLAASSLASVAGAQESGAADAGKAPASASEQAAGQQSDTEATQTAPQPGSSDSTFNPTEEISEDLSVSFPIDI